MSLIVDRMFKRTIFLKI